MSDRSQIRKIIKMMSEQEYSEDGYPTNGQIKREIDKLSDIDILAPDERTILCYACEQRNATLVKYALNSGANAGSLCDDKTPLQYALDVENSDFDRSPEFKTDTIMFIVDLLLKTGNANPEHYINHRNKSVLVKATRIFWLEPVAIRIWCYLVDYNLQHIVSENTKTRITENARSKRMERFIWYLNNYNKTIETLYATKSKGIDIDTESVSMLNDYLTGGRKKRARTTNFRKKRHITTRKHKG